MTLRGILALATALVLTACSGAEDERTELVIQRFFGACEAAISSPLRPSSFGWMLSLIHLASHHSTGSTATPCR